MNITFCDAQNYKKQIKRLYREAFPRKERLPLSFLFLRSGSGRDIVSLFRRSSSGRDNASLFRRIRSGRDIASFKAILNNGVFLGLIYTIHADDKVCLYYFALDKEKRGYGFGSRILQMLEELYPGCSIVVLIENTEETGAENYKQRIGRLDFYRRSGYQQLHAVVCEAGVTYELLGTDTTITREDYLGLMRKFFGRVLYRILYIE